MELVIPGKTFLVGEYAALVGGSVLGLATAPGFKVRWPAQSSQSIQLHPNSPAGRLAQNLKCENLGFEFFDSYAPAGGFGRSTAEYLSVLVDSQLKSGSAKTNSFENLKSQYQSISRDCGAEASGLDLAIQYFGHVMKYRADSREFSSEAWAFSELEFFLVSTGQKVQTHEHLKNLDRSKFSDLVQLSAEVVQEYERKNQGAFIDSLKVWTERLIEKQLTAKHALQLKEKLESYSDVLFVKPCGALGADVLLVFCDIAKAEFVKAQIEKTGLIIRGRSANLIRGLLQQMSSLKSEALNVD